MPDYTCEAAAKQKGYKLICGVDEAGRGPLAGPVVCCAIVMPLGKEEIIEGVTDSKKLTEKKRKELSKIIKERAISCSIYAIESDEIDKINILEAVRLCMSRAVLGLNGIAKTVLVDGVNTKLHEICEDKGVNFEYIVKGDAKSYTIGCASIVAKVYRDTLMEEYAKIYPEYSFEKHKGYGTKVHIDKIKEIGPCKIHRRTFIKNFWGK